MATGNKQASTSTPTLLQPNFEVIDDSYSHEAKAGYHLSIFVAANRLICSVLDVEANKFIALQEYQFELDDSFNNTCKLITQQGSNSFYSGEYRSVSAALVDHRSTLIPGPLFDEQHADKLLQFNHGKNVGKAAHDLIPEINAQNVYMLPENVSTTIKKIFPNVQLFHFSTPLLETLLVKNKHSKEQQIFVHLLPTRLCVSVLKEGKLILYNSYPHQTNEDIVYYTLFAMEQLQLNPEKVPLAIWGEIPKNAALLQLLRTYVKNVHFGLRPDNVNYSLQFEEIPAHYYYHLFNHLILL